MSIVSIWLLAYALPATVTGAAVKLLPHAREETRMAIVHAGLALSIVLTHSFLRTVGAAFPWYPGPLWVGTCVVSLVIATIFLGRIGLWYALSAFVQQLTMMSIALLLLRAFPWHTAALLIVPFYVWGHTLRVERWLARVLLFTAWGTLSVLLASVLPNLYLLASLHTLLGALLVSRSLVHPRT